MEKETKEILKDHEKRIAKLENSFQTKPKTTKKKTSIKEFILLKKPKGDVQRTLAMGYYLENYEDVPSFNKEDLEKCFRTAKEKVPGNLTDMTYKNIRAGRMMEDDKKKDSLKAWVLTSSGEKFVENNFKKE